MDEECQRPAYRNLADALTTTRRYGSYALAGYIVKKGPEFRSWKTASIAAGIFITDALDGWLARKSKIPSAQGARNDEETDKVLYNNVMSALTIATGDQRYLGYLVANQIRDQVVGAKRGELREHGLKANSRRLGQYKTRVQAAAIVADLSPLGETLP